MQDTDRLRELTERLTGANRVSYETPILNERAKTHGDFDSNARLSQRFRAVMRAEEGWDRLSDRHRQALDEISVKIGRILSGDPTFSEHWLDLAGYSMLCAERPNGQT